MKPIISPNNRQLRAHRAFTLIEILVVIAIIGLLAAILFPVFGRARESARRSSCLSNLKQLGLGLYQYSQDYDERMPKNDWAWDLRPYTKSEQILQCPSEKYAGSSDGRTGRYTDYTMNTGIMRGNGGSTAIGVKLSQMDYPAYTLMLVEHEPSSSPAACPSDGRGTAWNNQRGGPNPGLAESSQIPWDRHLGGSNLLFADGHVKWAYGDSTDFSQKVYAVSATFATSKDSPTFHVSDGVTTIPVGATGYCPTLYP